jgi:tetratricopeptide (TPR) repeat protein
MFVNRGSSNAARWRSPNALNYVLPIVCGTFLFAPGLWAQRVQGLSDGFLKIAEAFQRQSPEMSQPLRRVTRASGRYQKLDDTPDPAFSLLLVAYNALREEDLDKAISYFNQAAAVDPQRTDILQNLGYTYFKVGADEQARQQFLKVTAIDPTDFHSALEVAFLTYEINDPGQKATARRMFLQISGSGDPVSQQTAQQAFANIDSSLASQISSALASLALDPTNLTLHYQLGQLAEERDDIDLAVQHYTAAEPLQSGLVYTSLARVLLTAGRTSEARAALMTATHLNDPYSAEQAKDQLAQLPPP